MLRMILLPLIWFFRFVLGRDRLSSALTVDLGATVEQTRAIFGEPVDGPDGDQGHGALGSKGESIYWFDNGIFHQARCCFRDNQLFQVTYWSTYPHPLADLQFIFKRYGEGKKWQDRNPGYMYWREDGEIMIGCSAIPAIVVKRISVNRD